MPKFESPGVTLHYTSSGSGEPLLLLPGALGTGEGDFHHQIERFSQHYQVVAPDPRGYGQSRPPERDYPLDFYRRDANDMLALMSHLGHESFAILGWSDGANIAVLMATQQPARIEKLVLWGGNSFLTREEITAFQQIRSISSWSSRAAEAMRQIYGAELDALWERYVDGLQAIYNAGGDIYQSLLPQVKCPTLILHGEKDPLVPSLHPETIHRGIAKSLLYVFPDGKHNIHIRYPEEFNQIVLSFLPKGVVPLPVVSSTLAL
ncbi:alpha/beta hydrolase [Granulicella sp. dw_53]|uniref:alpha/beta fold hydrolase n=1 Tax=Granulicella sp. dw_53 TaxID=2719792 RepID=UPI001BD48F79|nr:alpha/beta hydrolase [Granulicella sp. dw_53]